MNSIKTIAQLEKLYKTGELYKFNITNGRIEKKNFVGRVVAWILKFIGCRTNLTLFFAAATKEFRKLPSEVELLQVKFTEAKLNTAEILRVRSAASIIFINPERILSASTFPKLKEEVEKLKESTVHFGPKGSGLEEFMKITMGSGSTFVSDEEFNTQFDIDVTRNDWCFGKEKIERNLLTTRLVEKLEEKHLNNEKRLRLIHLFCNQTSGNAVITGQGKLPFDIMKKSVLYKLTNSFYQSYKAPLRAHVEDTCFSFSEDMKRVAYKGIWHVKMRETSETTQVKIKSKVIMDFENDTLTFKPMYKVKVQDTCTAQELEILLPTLSVH